MNIPVFGEVVFNCDRRIWQTILFEKVFYQWQYDDVNSARILPVLEAQAAGRIRKIVLCNDIHTSSAWDILSSHTGIPVEHYLTQRINENKSIVDQSLCVKACQEYYENHADGILLFGSDSDYWGLFSLLRTVNYFVMVESSKFGINHQQALEKAGIYYHDILLDAFRKHDAKRARAMMSERLQHGLYGLESDNLIHLEE